MLTKLRNGVWSLFFCYYHVTFAKFNLKIIYYLSHERKFWHYQNTNVDHTQEIGELTWNNCLASIHINAI